MARTSTTAEAARVVGLAPTTLQKYAQRGRVPFNVTPGGHRRFDPKEVAEALGGVPAIGATRAVVAGWLDELDEGLRPTHVTIFGSVARGEQERHSDIDLLVVRPQGLAYGDRDWADARARIILMVHRQLGRSLDVLDLGEDDLPRLARTAPILAAHLVAEGVVIHGEPLLDYFGDVRLEA